MSIDLPNQNGEHPEAEKIPKDEVIKNLRLIIDGWDFDNPVAEPLNNNFALNFTHWILENFGRSYSSGDFDLYPNSEGFRGEDLPEDLRQLVISNWGNELLYSGDNKVRILSQHLYIEDGPEIPGWDEIRSRFTTIQEIIDYVASRPEIIAGIKQRVVSVMPQACLQFEPGLSQSWGLEYLVNELGIKVAPYGREGRTRAATEYVLQNFDKQTLLARTVCELAFLGACSSDTAPQAFQPDCLIHLQKRLDGEEPIPLRAGSFKANPANSIIDLVIRKIT